MSKTKKLLIAAVCLVAILTTAVVGTIAWLTDKTETVKNTFSPSNIDITLTETKGTGTLPNKTFKMVPGTTIDKDPVVTVKAISEKCWLFVKIEKTNGFDNFMAYAVDSEWTELATGSGIYYRQVAASNADQPFSILGAGTVTVNDITCTWTKNQVLVRPDVTESMMESLTDVTKYPTLIFTAYAIQQEGIADANANGTAVDEAWAAASAQQ